MAVRSILVKDTLAVAKVALFGKNAEHSYSEGDVVKVSAVYPKQYNNKLQLSTCTGSTCEVRTQKMLYHDVCTQPSDCKR